MSVAHGHWIALTVLMVLRPETAHTYTRCVGRVAGIAAGIVVASVLTWVWQPTGSSAAVVAVVFLAVTYLVTRFGYLAVSAALAAAIMFLLDIDAAAAGSGNRRPCCSRWSSAAVWRWWPMWCCRTTG